MVGAGLVVVAVVVLVTARASLSRFTVVRFCPPRGIPPVELVSSVEVVPGCTPLPEVVEGPFVDPGTV